MTQNTILRWVKLTLSILIVYALVAQVLPIISLQSALIRVAAATSLITFNGPVHLTEELTQRTGVTGNTLGATTFNGDIVIAPNNTLVGYSIVLEHHTSDDVLTLAESNSMHTNFGASTSTTVTLPALAMAGTLFRFVVMASQELRVEVSTAGQTIYANAAANTDDGGADLYIESNGPGEAMTLVADGNDDWVVVQQAGTWTVTQP